jgi:hypothetical protein
MKMKFVPDQPIIGVLQDRLNLSEFSARIWDAIQCSDPPFVFGLIGDWGSGKTSALSILQDQIRKQPIDDTAFYFVPIWFNPWLYENETNIIYPLLHVIHEDYQDHFKNLDRAGNFLTALKKVSYVSTMAVTDLALKAVTNHVMGQALSLDDLVARLKEFEDKSESLNAILAQWADNIGSLKKAFQELLQAYADDLAHKLTADNPSKKFNSDNIRFVILLDDLDRCLPQTAITVLENIKNFLSSDKCIYVLALNHKIVHQGIATKYQGVNIDGRQYLEKILNYSFYIPRPSSESLDKFAINSLRSLAPELLDADTQSAFEQFGATVRECHFDNPRKLKRVLNQYLLYLNKYLTHEKIPFLQNITKFIIMGEYYPEIYQIFIKVPERAKSTLAGLGSSNFSIEKFKDIYGINIANYYSELTRIKQIFSIDLTFEKYPVAQQIQDVNDILSAEQGG